MARMLTKVRMAVMGDDIVGRLRRAESLTRGPLYSLAIEALQEIELLRSLVNELADAEQGDSEQAWSNALTALYQAVGR